MTLLELTAKEGYPDKIWRLPAWSISYPPLANGQAEEKVSYLINPSIFEAEAAGSDALVTEEYEVDYAD